jgi:hypothetical protein
MLFKLFDLVVRIKTFNRIKFHDLLENADFNHIESISFTIT